jgi:uncharacterized membrane protein
MKLSWRAELAQWFVIAAMFAVAAAAWSHVPERMPIHWNMHGEVDGYGGKFAGLLLVPLLAVGLYLLLLFVPRLDPAYQNYAQFAGTYLALRFAMLLFLAAIFGGIVLAALGYRVQILTVVAWSMAGLFALLGAVMKRLRPNWMVGVRTPWTLSSERSWTKTHRLAGWLFYVIAALMVVWGAMPGAAMFVITMTALGVSVVALVVYSYRVYCHDPNRLPVRGSLGPK